MHPRTTTTTSETFSWQWPCGTACKMERQVTVSCPPHGCRCCWHGAAAPPSSAAGHRHRHHAAQHHHRYHQQEHQYALQGGTATTWGSLAAEEPNPTPPATAAGGRRTPLHAPPPVAAAKEPNNTPAPASAPADRRRTPLHHNHPLAAAAAGEFWVPDPHLMVQQLREFEPLSDEAVALRAQLQEYMPDVDRSKEEAGSAGWFLALPESVRRVLVAARDAIGSYSCVAVSSTTPPAPAK